MDNKHAYLIEMYNDEYEGTLGIASTQDKAVQMIDRMKAEDEVYGQCYQFRYYKIPMDYIEINDEPVHF